jgi:hypothetical protein
MTDRVKFFLKKELTERPLKYFELASGDSMVVIAREEPTLEA